VKLLTITAALAIPASAAARPAPLYADLFREGASWSYDSRIYVDGPPDGDPQKPYVTSDTHHTITCTVDHARRFRGGLVSEVSCDEPDDPPGGAHLIVGRWVSTARGLYRVGGDWTARGNLSVTSADLIIAAHPRAGVRHPDGDELVTLTIRKDHGAWCVDYVTKHGDDGDWTYCFADGTLSSGSFVWGGVTENEGDLRRLP
jgi:hypothetical protein